MTATRLQLAAGLALPPDAITQTFGILAVRGAGKSNLAAVMAEEMWKAGLPFVVVDPVGSWWGLRSSGDGKGPGLALPIFGGRQADVPLEKTGGQLLADLVVDQRLSCVLDVSEFSEGDKVRFLVDFAERLYRRNTDPLHLFLEEADDYAPQRPFREQARLLGAWENIVRRGRARGLGITMVTQRSAALNKNVLTQIETLFVLRTTSPQDRKAIAAWVEYHGQARELLESLPGLESGEAWVWSPSWLRIMKRVHVRRRETFDSGATPKNTHGGRPPATKADVDLAAVRARMADTIERAKTEDPRELRRRVAELEAQLRTRAAAPAAKPPRNVAVLRPGELRRVEVAVQRLRDGAAALLTRHAHQVDQLSQRMQVVVTEAELLRQSLEKVTGAAAPRRDTSAPAAAPRAGGPRKDVTPARRASTNGHEGRGLAAGERVVLTAAAQHGERGVYRDQLSVLTGYRRSSRDTYLQRLRAAGLVEERMGAVVATLAGVTALGADFEPLPTGPALRAYWLERLPRGEARILTELIEAYPRAVSRETLDERTGYKRSARDTYLQRLAARRLVTMARGEVTAREELFA